MNTFGAQCKPKWSKVHIASGSVLLRQASMIRGTSKLKKLGLTEMEMAHCSSEDMTVFLKKILLDLASEIISNNVLIYPDIKKKQHDSPPCIH